MLLEGKLLGHYQLQQQIGSGGMGTVYLAHDTHVPRQVAVKVVRADTELYENAEAADKIARLFQREVQLIARLDHPHILQVFDSGEVNINHSRYVYLVMPYRQEGSLVDWLRKRQQGQSLTPQEIGVLLLQAAEALQYAHEHGVVHQDVKPSNFLLRTRATVSQPDLLPDLLLADFGIARILTATASSTSQGIRGTPFYMSPEQWDGKPVAASDQYALAIMTFQLLTGQFPFQGGAGQVMRMHYMEQPPVPSSLNPKVPTALDAVIVRALSKQAEERFPSIKAFASAFAEALHSSGALSISRNLTENETLALSELPTKSADETVPVLGSTTSSMSDTAKPTLPAPAGWSSVGDDSVWGTAPLAPETASTILQSGGSAAATSPPTPPSAPWSTPTDPDSVPNPQALIDRPPPLKKHTTLYRWLLISMVALVVLAASGILLYNNPPHLALGSTSTPPGAYQQGQTPGTNGHPGSAAGAATATHTSITAGGPGSEVPTYPPGTTPPPGYTPPPGVTPTSIPGVTPTATTVQPTPTPTSTPVTPTPTPTQGPGANLLMNPGFENGYDYNWCVWDNNTSNYYCGANAGNHNSIEESGNSHSGNWHRVNGYGAGDYTTYQTISAPVSGCYSASIWVTTGGNTTNTYFFLKDTRTSAASNSLNIPAGITSWTRYSVGPLCNVPQGDPIAIEIRSINNSGQWVRFDDASMWYS